MQIALASFLGSTLAISPQHLTVCEGRRCGMSLLVTATLRETAHEDLS